MTKKLLYLLIQYINPNTGEQFRDKYPLQITDWEGELRKARGKAPKLTVQERYKRRQEEARANDTARDRIYGENEAFTWQERREVVDNLTEDSAPRQFRVKLVTEEHIHRPNVFKVSYTRMVKVS